MPYKKVWPPLSRTFSWTVGAFRPFIQDFDNQTLCLMCLTQDVPFEWPNECEVLHKRHAQAISSNSVLMLPDFDLSFELNTDIYHHETGALLHQRDTTKPTSLKLRVIGYHSCIFPKPEVSYETTEKRALGVLKDLWHIRSNLKGYKLK